MADAAQLHMAMWRKEQIVRHIVSNVAVAIQRENAATVLAGHAAIDFTVGARQLAQMWTVRSSRPRTRHPELWTHGRGNAL